MLMTGAIHRYIHYIHVLGDSHDQFGIIMIIIETAITECNILPISGVFACTHTRLTHSVRL